MSWLLGSLVGVGVVSTAALAIYLIKMAHTNRSDLRELLSSQKELTEAKRDIDGYKRNVQDRDNALTALNEKLERNDSALRFARTALEAATKKLAERGDASSVSADLNDTLGELSKMSAMSGP